MIHFIMTIWDYLINTLIITDISFTAESAIPKASSDLAGARIIKDAGSMAGSISSFIKGIKFRETLVLELGCINFILGRPIYT